jgi:hypothetical protein
MRRPRPLRAKQCRDVVVPGLTDMRKDSGRSREPPERKRALLSDVRVSPRLARVLQLGAARITNRPRRIHRPVLVARGAVRDQLVRSERRPARGGELGHSVLVSVVRFDERSHGLHLVRSIPGPFVHWQVMRERTSARTVALTAAKIRLLRRCNRRKKFFHNRRVLRAEGGKKRLGRHEAGRSVEYMCS